MTGGTEHRLEGAGRDEIAAALGWLVAAGVDTIVGDVPFAWLSDAGPVVRRSVAPPATVAARAAEIATINADSLSALAAALLEAHPTALFADGTGEVMVIGDRPTAADAAAGRLFSDAAGTLLDRMLAAIGRTRGDTYLANAVQWPGSGPATPAEAAAAAPFLRRQIALARPKAILALGQGAATALTGSTAGINRQRGHWVEVDGVPVMPTFAPAHLLRHPGHKALAWADLCALKARLDA